MVRLHNMTFMVGGGGGFFLACEDFGRIFDSQNAAFYALLAAVRQKPALFALFRPEPVHNGSAS